MANTQSKERTPIGERARFSVPVYADEIGSLGLTNDMKLSEAQAVLRGRLGVALPLRQRTQASVSGLSKAITSADPETRARIIELLNGLDE